MDWNSIIVGMVKGLAQAVIWAAIVWIWQIAKTFRIRREIRKSFVGKKATSWKPPNLFGILIKNSSPWSVTIRSAGFSSGINVFGCGYLGNKQPIYDKHILLKTDTEDTWGFPIEKLGMKIESVWVIYEYDTFFGRSKVERIELGQDVAQFFEGQRVRLRETFKLPQFDEDHSTPLSLPL